MESIQVLLEVPVRSAPKRKQSKLLQVAGGTLQLPIGEKPLRQMDETSPVSHLTNNLQTLTALFNELGWSEDQRAKHLNVIFAAVDKACISVLQDVQSEKSSLENQITTAREQIHKIRKQLGDAVEPDSTAENKTETLTMRAKALNIQFIALEKVRLKLS